MQPVFIQYKVYVCVYLSKNKDECSHVMNEALRDAFEKEIDNYEQKKCLAWAYLCKKKCSVQECIYYILPSQ